MHNHCDYLSGKILPYSRPVYERLIWPIISLVLATFEFRLLPKTNELLTENTSMHYCMTLCKIFAGLNTVSWYIGYKSN